MDCLNTKDVFFFRKGSIIPKVIKWIFYFNDCYFERGDDLFLMRTAYPISQALNYDRYDLSYRKQTFYGNQEVKDAIRSVESRLIYKIHDAISIDYNGKEFVFTRDDIKNKTEEEIIALLKSD